MHNNIKKLTSTAVAASLCFLLAGTKISRSEELCKLDSKIKQVSQELINKHKDAIVMVRVVIKTKASFGGREMDKGREEKIETAGTILDSTGITIISHSQIDRSQYYEMMEGYEDYKEEGMGGFKMDSSIADINIVLNDGKKLPATIVLKDKDFDIAFIKPQEKGLQLPFLQIAKTPAPQIFDWVININRCDFSTGREPYAYASQISAIIKKPRTCYYGGGDLGLPVFNLDGQCLGIGLTLPRPQKQGGFFSYSDPLSIILPCEDILETMKQVPAEKEKGK